MLWIKAFHIIAVITWFAGLFYLPRLFVYHSMTNDTLGRARFQTMERKLFNGIMTPSMILVIFLGGWLYTFNNEYYSNATWMNAKLFCVALLVIYHGLCWHFMRTFYNKVQFGNLFFRWFNEIPVLLLLAIIILVVVKPNLNFL